MKFLTLLVSLLITSLIHVNAQQCPSEILVMPSENCLSYHFELTDDSFGNVIWDFSEAGAEASGIGIDHTYPGPGTYTVCANPVSMSCDPLCITITVACPNCDLDVEVIQQTNEYVILGASNFPDSALVHWTQNGEQVNIGSITTFVFEPGLNELCAYYETPDCPEGVFWCETFLGETNPLDDCPTELVIEEIECGWYEVTLNGAIADANIYWNLGDNNVYQGDGLPQIVQLTPGTYFLFAVYWHPNYPQCSNVTYFLEVTIEDCDPNPTDCPTTINYTTINECGVYIFNLNNFGNFGNIVWNWGDGGSNSGANNVGHSYFESGTYEVCVEAWTSACPQGVEICIPLVVPDCDIECPGEIVATELECGVWQFSIEPGSSVMGATWVFGDGNFGQSDGNSIIHQFDSTGVFTVTVNSSLNQPCFNNYFTITIIVEECGELSCPDQMIITPGNYCGSYFFTVNHPGSIDNIFWSWGDGFFGGGNQINAWHSYQEAGTYEVCAEITADSCSNVVYEICQTIEVPECPECPTEIMFVQDSCQTYTFWLEYAYPFGTVQWNFGGNIITAAGNAPVTVFLESGVNMIYAIYSAANYPQCSGVVYTIEVEVDDCDNLCPSSLNIQEMTCGYYYFMGWGNAGEEIMWSYSIGNDDYNFTTSNNGFISQIFMTPGSYEICAVYFSDNCPNGVQLCETINVPTCNPDDCSLTLTYSYLGNGFFNFVADGNGGILPLFWDYGNGETMNATWVTQHQFEPGTYTVCASYESPICTFPVTACVTIVVPEPEECEGYVLSFQSQLSNTGFSVVTFSLTDGNGIQFQGGTFFVTDVVGYFEGEVCLPDGCYTLDLSALAGLGISVSDLDLLLNGLPFDGFVQIVQVSNTEVQVLIDINGDCDFSTGINDDILADIQVYPVPATDILNIVIPSGERVDATIFSSAGQIIYSEQLNQSVQLNTTNWASGLYLLKLENNYSAKTQRIQKF
jgi:hypothetical protein